VGVREPGAGWVFALAFRYLSDDALRSCPGGVLRCGVPEQLAEFRQWVVDSPAYRAASRLKPLGTSVCYGPVAVCRPPGQAGLLFPIMVNCIRELTVRKRSGTWVVPCPVPSTPPWSRPYNSGRGR